VVSARDQEVSAVADLVPLGSPNPAGEDASFVVVVKKLAQSRGGKIGISHEDS
jgi:hypothetical protein